MPGVRSNALQCPAEHHRAEGKRGIAVIGRAAGPPCKGAGPEGHLAEGVPSAAAAHSLSSLMIIRRPQTTAALEARTRSAAPQAQLTCASCTAFIGHLSAVLCTHSMPTLSAGNAGLGLSRWVWWWVWWCRQGSIGLDSCARSFYAHPKSIIRKGYEPAVPFCSATVSTCQTLQCIVQDKGASSSMEAAMDLMQLNGIIRRAINLVTGAQIHVDETMFEFAVTSIIPGFKVYSRAHVFMMHAPCAFVMCSQMKGFRGDPFAQNSQKLAQKDPS